MNPHSSREGRIRLRDRLREETASAILSAAEEAFAAEGLHARMESIAARAGVAVGTVYNHFADLEALLQDLVDSRRRALLGELDAALEAARAAPFEGQLRAAVGALLGHWSRHLRFLTLLVQAGHLGKRAPRPGQRNIVQEIHARLGRVLARGVAEGRLRAEHAELYPALLGGMARGVLVREVDEEAPRLERHVDTLVDLVLRGAGRAP